MKAMLSEQRVYFILLVVGSILCLLIASELIPPTQSEATQQILAEHPECADQLRLEERLVEGTYGAPGGEPDYYASYLVCDQAIVSIEVRIR